MVKSVDEIHVENALHTRIKDCKPVVTFALEMRWEPVRVKLAKAVTDIQRVWWSLYSWLALILGYRHF